MNDRSLAEASRPPGSGADLVCRRDGGLATIEPLTARSEHWLSAMADGDATWIGPCLISELRFFPAIADAAIAAGLRFERATLLN